MWPFFNILSMSHQSGSAPLSRGLSLLDLSLRQSVPFRDLPDVRVACRVCQQRRHLICTKCAQLCLPDEVHLREPPRLPLTVHVWRSAAEEKNNKSTSTHIAALAAPGDARVYGLDSLPEYDDPEGVLLLFPSPSSVTAAELPVGDLSRCECAALKLCRSHARPESTTPLCPPTHADPPPHTTTTSQFAALSHAPPPFAIFAHMRVPVYARMRVFARTDHTLVSIDCTWNQSGSMLALVKTGAAAKFRHVSLSRYETLFWRHQPFGAQCLATVEAIYFFLREFYVESMRRRGRSEASPPKWAGAPLAVLAASAPDSAASSALAAKGELTAAAACASAAAPAFAEAAPAVPAVSACSGGAATAGAACIEGSGGGDGAISTSGGAAHLCDAAYTVYDGRFDDLVLIFLKTYSRIQREYTEGASSNRHFTAKMRPGYIRGRAAAAAEADRAGRRPRTDDSEEDAAGACVGDGAGSAAAASTGPPLYALSSAVVDSGSGVGARDGSIEEDGGSAAAECSAGVAMAGAGPPVRKRVRGSYCIRTDLRGDASATARSSSARSGGIAGTELAAASGVAPSSA